MIFAPAEVKAKANESCLTGGQIHEIDKTGLATIDNPNVNQSRSIQY